MKIVIPSYNRAHTLVTPQWLEAGGVRDYTLLLHSEGQRELYVGNPSLRAETIALSGVAPGLNGLAAQRNWALDNLAESGEWLWFIDDDQDVWNGTRLDLISWAGRDAGRWAKIAFESLSSEEVLSVAQTMAGMADRMGIHLCGFGRVNNPMHLSAQVCGKGRWSYYGMVSGGSFLIKESGFRFPDNLTYDDVYATAAHLWRDECVLIDQLTRLELSMFHEGGLGGGEERRYAPIKDFRILERDLPGMTKLCEMVIGGERGLALHLRFRKEEDFLRWRRRKLGETNG